MGDLVCDGTEFNCPRFTSSLKLCVSSSLAQGETKNIANLVNGHFPPPGGMCLIKNVCCNPDVQVVAPGQNVVQLTTSNEHASQNIFGKISGSYDPATPFFRKETFFLISKADISYLGVFQELYKEGYASI